MNGLSDRPLTDVDRARMLAEAEEMMANRRRDMAAVEARRIGPAVLITIGCEVFSKDRRREDHGELVPLGGVVVAITEGERDPDTGFIARRFTVLDPGQRPDQWEHVLEEAELDAEVTTAPNTGRLVTLITRLQQEGGKRKGRLLTPRDGRFIEYERALKAVVMP